MFIKIIRMLMFVLITVYESFAQTDHIPSYHVELAKDIVNNNYKHALENLLLGLKSENSGVLKSCIYFSGKYKVDKAVNSLVRILNSSSTSENIKLLTALSLYEIGNDEGIYHLAQASKFDSSDRIKRKCLLLYQEFVLNKKDQL